MTQKSLDEDVSPFGRLVDDELGRQGRTRKWLQEQLGVSRSTLYRYLTRQRVQLEDIQRIAGALGVRVASLLPGDVMVEELEDMLHPVHTEAGRELEDFFGSVERVIRTLSTASDQSAMDPKSKLAILNGIEEAARLAGQKLPPEFWRLRQAVVEGG